MGNLISISTPTPTPWPAPLTSAAAQRGPHTVGATRSCGATGKVYISLYRYIHIYIHFIFIICILFICSYLFIFIHIHSYSFIFIHIHSFSFIFIHIHIFVLYAYYIIYLYIISYRCLAMTHWLKFRKPRMFSVHPHRISLTTLRSEGLIVQHQPMLMIKRPADHDKVNPQKATTAHMWTTTLLQATKRSARHRETWTKTETSWVHPSHNKTETCTQTPVSLPHRWQVGTEVETWAQDATKAKSHEPHTTIRRTIS